MKFLLKIETENNPSVNTSVDVADLLLSMAVLIPEYADKFRPGERVPIIDAHNQNVGWWSLTGAAPASSTNDLLDFLPKTK